MEWTWLRWELRRRWRSLLGLVLLVACATAVVGAALAGAGRASSALPRLLDQTAPATLNILPNEPKWDWEPVRAIPEVEAIATAHPALRASWTSRAIPGLAGNAPDSTRST